MNYNALKARMREDAAEEAREDEEQEARIEQRLRKWKRGTILLGIALVASIAAVIPFLAGNPLHAHWDAIGKRILQLAMGLFLAFVYVAGTYSTFWKYLRGMKSIHRKSAPPGSKYRMSR